MLYTAIEPVPESERFKLFLGGSIEMGKATKWQAKFYSKIKDLDIDVINPRRDQFSDLDDNELTKQINWELDGIEMASMVIFYFEKNTKSPITLLELGLAHKKPCVVCCNTEYWKYKNVETTCKYYDIPLTNEKEFFFTKLENFLRTKI